jgi:hypothetical protein
MLYWKPEEIIEHWMNEAEIDSNRGILALFELRTSFRIPSTLYDFPHLWEKLPSPKDNFEEHEFDQPDEEFEED